MGIELVMVFDGAPMPCKGNTEEDRRLNRLDSLKKAEEFEKMGNPREAEKYYTRAVDVTPFLAREIIEELQKYNIECIVAPYEADAQLAYLSKIGYISGVLSEDSDLIVFQSTKVLYKLGNSGEVKELLLSDLWNHPNYNLKRWNHDQFVTMCILAGCDYLKSCRNIGIKTAYKYVSQNPDLKQIIYKLKREVGNVPSDYEEQFVKAINSFKYHRVFCPLTGEITNLNPVPAELAGNDWSYLGEPFDRELMIGIARGRIHPFTKEPFVNANFKRKIDEIFNPVQKIVQVKKIKVCDEVKSIAQKIRIEKNTQKSKYFEDKEVTERSSEEEVNREKGYEGSSESSVMPIRKDLYQKFIPHVFPNSSHTGNTQTEDPNVDESRFLKSIDNIYFRPIDLKSIYLRTN